jgi:hypothetical protein
MHCTANRKTGLSMLNQTRELSPTQRKQQQAGTSVKTHLMASVGLERLLPPAPLVMRIASEGLCGLAGSLGPSSPVGEASIGAGMAVLGDRGMPSALSCWCSASLVSKVGMSFSMAVKGWWPLTVDMEDIREWHPDWRDEEAYEDKLL